MGGPSAKKTGLRITDSGDIEKMTDVESIEEMTDLESIERNNRT
jgi:hypothetical protein